MRLDWILSATALLLAVLAVRAAFGRRISARLRYALWLLAALRLLVPVSLGENSLSPANLLRALDGMSAVQADTPVSSGTPAGAAANAALAKPQALPDQQTAAAAVAPPDYQTAGDSAGTPAADDLPTLSSGSAEDSGAAEPVSWGAVLHAVWLAGAALTASWFVLCNLLFFRWLRRSRRRLGSTGRPAVYTADVPSPCVFGLLRPAIYVTETAAADEAVLADVLLHERAHLSAHDQLWALVRTACLIVWWFHPLVWLAARLARRDCELACDERALRGLDPARRARYGRTLLSLAARPGQLTAQSAATAGFCAEPELAGRIRAIARNRRPRRAAMLAAALLALLAAGCSFTGAQQSVISLPEQPDTARLDAAQTDAPEETGSGDPLTRSDPDPAADTPAQSAAIPAWAEDTAAEAWIGGWCGVVDEAGRWAPGTDDAAALSALLDAAAALPDGSDANARFLIDCWACLLALGDELENRSWASSDALSGVFGAMTSRLGGLDMPLETETLGEWWEEYLALAHRSYAADDPCPDGEAALTWTLAQMSRQSPTPTSIHLRLFDGSTVQTEAYAALSREWSAQLDKMTTMCDELFVSSLAANADTLLPLGVFDLDAVWQLDAAEKTAVMTIAVPGGTDVVLTCAMDTQTVQRTDAAEQAPSGIVADGDLVMPNGVTLGMTFDEALALLGSAEESYSGDDPSVLSIMVDGIHYGFRDDTDGFLHLTSYSTDSEDAEGMPFGLSCGDTLYDLLAVFGLTEPAEGILYGEQGQPGSAWLERVDALGGWNLHVITPGGWIWTAATGRADQIWTITVGEQFVKTFFLIFEIESA